MKRRFLKKTGYILIAALLLSFITLATAAENKPPTQYWMNVSTQNMSVPGMSSEEMGGFEGMMAGRMAGMGPKRNLLLQLNSPKAVPADPEAAHDIPPGQKMGSTLPLIIPERPKPVKEEEGEETKYEKPKVRMLMYWGCSETVKQGQPKILDTEKMSMIDFGKAMAGRSGSRQQPPSPRAGWAYAEWPSKRHHQDIPKGSSLQGDHFIHGNYTPDIKFAVGEKYDFMAPVEFSSVRGGLTDSIKFQWKKIPTALGYFAMAMASNEKTGEMVIWSSSEIQEPGYGLLNYLAPADVSRLIKEKVVMGPDTTQCSIPRGIFKEANGAAVQFIGYGDELNIAWPPKPKDSKKPHDYIWTMKLRNKSTGILPLGQEDGREERKMRGRQTEQDEKSADKEKGEEEPQKKKGGLLKGLFGF
jgi:hypothetical protein